MPEQKKSMNRVARWGLIAALLVACGYAGLQIYNPPPPEVPTARVERRDFVVTIRGRGEVKSTNSATVTAPQTPDLRIARLAENGKPIRAGEVMVEFDPAAQEDRHLERQTEVRQADSEILQARAQHSIADEQNAMLIMQSGYNVERAKLEASKQEILSEIEGLKNRIDVTITEGELSMAETNAKATDLSQDADLARIEEQKAKAVRDRVTQGRDEIEARHHERHGEQVPDDQPARRAPSLVLLCEKIHAASR
jgi:multidrug efflux pump subunit AcrA (membrane-fusion protein)